MKPYLKQLTCALMLSAIVLSTPVVVLNCGPVDLVPVFSSKHSPDFPYTGYADGNLGIVRPEYPRMVLFAAYRYMSGSNFTGYERKELIKAWKEFYDRAPANRDGVTEAIKDWISERSGAVLDEETPPDIYTEKPYTDTYDFFPNCSKNAFEVARDTLSSRVASHGSSDPWVQEWIKGQDTVFRNCSDTRIMPSPPTSSMPEWLQKDRAYQMAAAEFYALKYSSAKARFANIALDSDSPWQEVAEYLVPRTLVRHASLNPSAERSRLLYSEAEQSLESIYAGGGKYSEAAEDLLGTVKYRIRPEQRVQELAQNLSYYGGDDLKQDLIDYTWLLDKFETSALKAAEERKKKAEESLSKSEKKDESIAERGARLLFSAMAEKRSNQDESKVRIYFYNDNYSQSWNIWIDPEASDEEVAKQAEAVAGPLTDKMRERLKEARQSAYQSRFANRPPEYEGGYWGDERTTLAILPRFLLTSDLTEWLFTFQMTGSDAYLHSLTRFRQTNSDAWLVSAISKAAPKSPEIRSLLESAGSIPTTSPAYTTAAYHSARILVAQGREAEARQTIDELLDSGVDLSISAKNELAAMRMNLAVSMDDFLRFALRKPFGFAFNQDFTSIDEVIRETKSYYNPEYYEETRDEYERKVEKEYEFARSIQSEPMLDRDSIRIINYHFSIPLLVEAQASPALPDYLRGRLASVIWTRAILLGEYAVADAIAPEVIKHHDEMRDAMKAYLEAKGTEARKTAALFVMLKNERISPYLASGFGTPTESLTFSSRWWCETYDTVWDDNLEQEIPAVPKKRPEFISASDSAQAQADMKKLKELGNAPAFFTARVLEWAAASRSDKRLPESIYIVFEANGWDKYGCGGDPVDRVKLKDLLYTNYRSTIWAQKALDDEQ